AEHVADVETAGAWSKARARSPWRHRWRDVNEGDPRTIVWDRVRACSRRIPIPECPSPNWADQFPHQGKAFLHRMGRTLASDRRISVNPSPSISHRTRLDARQTPPASADGGSNLHIQQ